MAENWRQIEGRNSVLEALRAGNEIFKIFLEEGVRANEKISQILKLARAGKIPIIKKNRKSLRRSSRTESHQGIIAQAAPLPDFSLQQILQTCESEKKDPLVVVLPQVLYEYNLGAVVRTAEAAGVDCLLISKRNWVTPLISRASMGAVEYLPIIKDNLFSGLKYLKRSGLKIVVAELRAKKTYFEVDLTGPLALVVGSEDKGLSETLLRYTDLSVKIPMKGRLDSLNLSVAAGVILYEIIRQRGVKSDS